MIAAERFRYAPDLPVSATLFIVILVAGIFAVDFVVRWWRENEWRRRWRQRDEE